MIFLCVLRPTVVLDDDDGDDRWLPRTGGRSKWGEDGKRVHISSYKMNKV